MDEDEKVYEWRGLNSVISSGLEYRALLCGGLFESFMEYTLLFAVWFLDCLIE